jgi:CubicO group peptidase (beta-lactamase class C family)
MSPDPLSATFAALADLTRRATLARLAAGETSVKKLSEPFAISAPAVTKNLKVLQRAGLITRGREAQWPANGGVNAAAPVTIDAIPRTQRHERDQQREKTMTNGGLSSSRLDRMHKVMAGHVERGDLPGLVALVSRRGEVHVDAIGMQAIGGTAPMRRDTIFRIASMTKPVTAAAAMILVEECKLRLDEPVDQLLPELANRKVLKRLDGPLDEAVPANRPITLRDLLTFRMGFGSVMAPPDTYPIQKAMRELRIGGDGPPIPDTAPAPDEWLRRLGSLPLMHQPGERWMYNTGSDVLGVLIARVTGQPLGKFLRERLFEPLGMKDTGFSVPSAKRGRLPGSYVWNSTTSALAVFDDAGDSHWSRPPAFESGAGGLVSTVDDYLAFCRMMLDKGRHGQERILSRPSVELMTTDQLTPEQRAGASIFFGDSRSWGFGVAIDIRRDNLATVPGRFGWDGGLGTSGYSDPTEDLVGILMTQRMMDSPEPPRVFVDFWTSAYQAIDD